MAAVRLCLCTLESFAISDHLHVLDLGESGVDEDQQARDDQQQHRQRRAQGPVPDRTKLVLDDVADVKHFAAAQDIGDGVDPQGGDEHQNDGGEDAGEGEGKRHLEKGLRRRGPQIGTGLQKGLLKLLNGAVEREHREGEHVGDKPQDHQPVCIDEGDGAVDETGPLEKVVYRTAGLEQQQPAVEPHEGVGPEGDHDEHDEPGGHLRRLAGNIVSEGIPQPQAQHCGEKGGLQRLEDDLEIGGIQQGLVALQGELVDHVAEHAPGHKADVDDKEHGKGDEKDHPDRDRTGLGQGGDGLAAHVPLSADGLEVAGAARLLAHTRTPLCMRLLDGH